MITPFAKAAGNTKLTLTSRALIAFAASSFIALSADPLYTDVDKVTEFYRQGGTIFNTSMPNDGERHYYTDNNPNSIESGAPTEIWVRDSSGARAITTPGFNIPADVHVSPDGKRLYFVEYGAEQSFIVSMQRLDNGWSKPLRVESLIMENGAGYPTSTNNGEVVFSSGGDIYYWDKKQIEKLPKAINSTEGEHDPFIAQDGSFLIFVRQQPEIGDSNMYISFRQDDGWSESIKLPAPFNLDKIDGSPYVTPDGRYLFFTSNRHGDGLRTYQAPFQQTFEKLEMSAMTSNHETHQLD